MEQLKYEGVTKASEGRVIARPFVAEESMLTVDLDPLKTGTHFFEARVNQIAAFEWNVGVLPAPDVEQFAFYFTGPFKRVVVHAPAQAATVDVGCVKANGRQHVRIHRGAESEMPTNANAHNSKPSAAG
jgi:hypothetical protein